MRRIILGFVALLSVAIFTAQTTVFSKTTIFQQTAIIGGPVVQSWNVVWVGGSNPAPSNPCAGNSLNCTLTSANTVGGTGFGAFPGCSPGQLLVVFMEVGNIGVVSTKIVSISGCGSSSLIPASGCQIFSGRDLDCAYVSNTGPGSTVTITRDTVGSGTAVWMIAMAILAYGKTPAVDNYLTGTLSSGSSCGGNFCYPGLNLTLSGTADVIFQADATGPAQTACQSPYNTYSISNDHFTMCLVANTSNGTPPNTLFTSTGSNPGVNAALAFQ